MASLIPWIFEGLACSSPGQILAGLEYSRSMEKPQSETSPKHISDEEGTGTEVEWIVEGEEEEETKAALAVVGRLWTERNVSANALIGTMKRVWNPKHGLQANCIEKNVFFFQFHHWKDKEHVMDAQPWHFDWHALVLSDVTGDCKPSEMPLHEVPFWVRIYDLPLMGRNNEANVRKIGNKVATFVAVDKSDVIGINKSLRVRTLVDLRKPLKKEISVTMRGGITKEFGVKYQKLPLLCYFCGKLGHDDKDCEAINQIENPKRKFSDKLRASPWHVNKGEVIDDDDEEGSGSCARQLFVAKNKEEKLKETREKVVDVTKQLEGVSLTLLNLEGTNEETTKAGSMGNELHVEEGKGTQEKATSVVPITDATETLTHSSIEPPLRFELGVNPPNTRGLRKVERVVDTNVCGKRKDAMEIDGDFLDEGGTMGKKSKAISEEGMVSNNQVAEVAEQPRENQ